MEAYKPKSIEELRALCHTMKDGTQILAGGTDWIIAHRKRSCDIPGILFLGDIEQLQKIYVQTDCVLIGACCTMSKLERAEELSGAWQVIREAAASVGSVQVRNRATIGGNIANASSAADLAAPLIALRAEATVLRNGETVMISVGELIVGKETTLLAKKDVILNFVVPRMPAAAISHYFKMGFRQEVSISRFGVAMVFLMNSEKVQLADIAVGAIGAKAVRMEKMEEAITDRSLNHETADVLGDILADYIRNTSGRRYKAWASRGVMASALKMFDEYKD